MLVGLPVCLRAASRTELRIGSLPAHQVRSPENSGIVDLKTRRLVLVGAHFLGFLRKGSRHHRLGTLLPSLIASTTRESGSLLSELQALQEQLCGRSDTHVRLCENGTQIEHAVFTLPAEASSYPTRWLSLIPSSDCIPSMNLVRLGKTNLSSDSKKIHSN